MLNRYVESFDCEMQGKELWRTFLGPSRTSGRIPAVEAGRSGAVGGRVSTRPLHQEDWEPALLLWPFAVVSVAEVAAAGTRGGGCRHHQEKRRQVWMEMPRGHTWET